MFAKLMGLRTITPAELSQSSSGGASITTIDVNSPQSWREAHVPGAINLDVATLSESDLPSDKDAPLVFYCSNPLCRKAPNAARRAKSMGYTDIRVMSAGIRGWLAAGLPTSAARDIASGG
jgi:rhodanese-related sulfurtransferase